ncbi:MAG: hypothetical protein JWQ95_5108 [Sphaerisporangium sp.]|jgi:hypothetical protein|nr:hypothetical protein [Sphaerisporangium sp.]
MQRQKRLTVTLACAATLAVVLGTGLTVAALVWPHHDETSARLRAEPSASVSAPFGDLADPGLDQAPSRWEEERATELLVADPLLGRRLRHDFTEATGRPPASAADLRVHSLIFRRHGCETRRCLQLFVRFPNGAWFDVGRVIVDLSTGNVRVLKW